MPNRNRSRLITFAQHELGVRNIEVGAEVRAMGSLYIMIRPQHLHPIGKLDRLIELLARIRTGERVVAARMPVLRQHDMTKPRGKLIDQRHDLVTAWDR